MNAYLIGMLISMVAYVVIGFVISKSVKSANDFYVAGRKAPTILIVGSLVASYCSTGLFMGDVGEAVRNKGTLFRWPKEALQARCSANFVP